MVQNSLANRTTTTTGPSAGIQIQAKTLTADADALKNVREGVNGLAETLPALVRGLEEVARIHPFIASMFDSF